MKHTRDFEVLNQIFTRAQAWVDRFEEQMKAVESKGAHEVVEVFEKLQGEYLPVPQQKMGQVNKVLRRARWMKRFQELRAADRVKLKQLEAINRDSAHQDIQEDEACRENSEWL